MDTPITPPDAGTAGQTRAELRALIARQSLTVPALAKKIGRSEKWLRNRLTGRVALTFEDVDEITAGLHSGVEVGFTYRTTTPPAVTR